MIIVTGLPRSGTSLAMRLLEAMGIPVLSEQTTDRHNPEGYYEGPWTTQGINSYNHRNQAAKVILCAIESCKLKEGDKVILCLRNPYEVAYSQAKDAGKFGSEQPERNLNAYFAGLSTFLEWKQDRPIFILDHAALMANPVWSITRLTEFIGAEISERQAGELSAMVKKHPAMGLYERLKNDSL